MPRSGQMFYIVRQATGQALERKTGFVFDAISVTLKKLVHFALYCPFHHDLTLISFNKAKVQALRMNRDLLAWFLNIKQSFADSIEQVWAIKKKPLYRQASAAM